MVLRQILRSKLFFTTFMVMLLVEICTFSYWIQYPGSAPLILLEEQVIETPSPQQDVMMRPLEYRSTDQLQAPNRNLNERQVLTYQEEAPSNVDNQPPPQPYQPEVIYENVPAPAREEYVSPPDRETEKLAPQQLDLSDIAGFSGTKTKSAYEREVERAQAFMGEKIANEEDFYRAEAQFDEEFYRLKAVRRNLYETRVQQAEAQFRGSNPVAAQVLDNLQRERAMGDHNGYNGYHNENRRRHDEMLVQNAARQTLQVNREKYALWKSGDPKYECYRTKGFQCHTMNNVDDTKLPDMWKGSCAPEFAIVGTAKSGTTSAYFYLAEHPQVNRALSGQFNKEVRYFTQKNFNKGSHWYMQQFAPLIPGDGNFTDSSLVYMMSGEASPTYFYEPEAASRIRTVAPHMKLIVMLRDPILRAYSDKQQLMANYVQHYANPYDDMLFQIQAFDECFDANKSIDSTTRFWECYNAPKLSERVIMSHPYVMDSIYIHQVRRWLKYFPREQILFVKSEDFYDKTREAMDRIINFLGLCPFEWGGIVEKVHNRRENRYAEIPDDVRKLLSNFYKPFTKQLYEELGEDFGWQL